MAEFQKFRPLGKKQGERYLNPVSGEIISSRRYRELRALAKSGNDAPEVNTTPDPDILRSYIDYIKATTGVSLSERRAMQSRELRAIVAGLHDETGAYQNVKGKTVYPADSPKARALILLGRRTKDENQPVGETYNS